MLTKFFFEKPSKNASFYQRTTKIKPFAMKTSARIPALFLFLFSFLLPSLLWANRTITGSFSCEGIDIPDMASVRINAFDSDGDTDDLMGRTYLINGKTFVIKYENKKWDPFPMDFISWWRPDIYLTAEIFENNQWITVYQSDIYEDWKIAYDLDLHIYVEFNEPIVRSTDFSPARHACPFHLLYLEKQSERRLSGDLSGGMCFSSLDNFYGYQPKSFANEESFEAHFASRQAAAEKDGRVAWQVENWQSLPDRPKWNKKNHLGYLTKAALAEVIKKIDQGKPVTIALIESSQNDRTANDVRQAVVYKYERDLTRRRTRLWLYDPGLIKQEEAILSVLAGYTDGSVSLQYNQERNTNFRAFFINPYDREEKRKTFAEKLEKASDLNQDL